MAAENRVSAVLYGESAVINQYGKFYDSARESILGLDVIIERGLILAPDTDDDAIADALKEAGLVDSWDIIASDTNQRSGRSYYDIYASAIERIRSWPAQTLVVESNPQAMEAARRLGAQLFAIAVTDDMITHAKSLEAVGIAPPNEFQAVNEYVYGQARIVVPS